MKLYIKRVTWKKITGYYANMLDLYKKGMKAYQIMRQYAEEKDLPAIEEGFIKKDWRNIAGAPEALRIRAGYLFYLARLRERAVWDTILNDLNVFQLKKRRGEIRKIVESGEDGAIWKIQCILLQYLDVQSIEDYHKEKEVSAA